MTKKYNPFQYQQSQGYEIASADTSQNDLGSNQDRISDIQSGTYTVRNGDSFWSIANQLNITIPSLLAVNGLNMNDVIHPKMELTIPIIVIVFNSFQPKRKELIDVFEKHALEHIAFQAPHRMSESIKRDIVVFKKSSI